MKQWKKDMALNCLNRVGLTILMCTFVGVVTTYAQKNTRAEYIAIWKKTAQQSMKANGIPASITLAQACLESADGNSELSVKGRNHFGIKCHGWDGKKVYHDDDKKHECFRKYRKAEQSFEDHATFLSERSRYAFLFEMDADDYKGWAKGLKKAGYATNPKYPALLIKIIEDNNLADIDAEVMSDGKRNRKKKKSKKEIKEEEQDAKIEQLAKEELDKKLVSDAQKGSKEKVVSEKPSLKNESKEEGASTPEFDETIEVTVGKEVMVHVNNVKFVLAEGGDTPVTIAEELNLGEWQIEKYNDIGNTWRFEQGDVVFIQPKRNKAKQPTHRIATGETLWDISQLHAVSLDKLMNYNQLDARSELRPGDQIFLRKP
jgi:LysM repeat protein